MTSKLEDVARAMWSADRNNPEGTVISESMDGPEDIVLLASAAIEALREPAPETSAAMMLAMIDTPSARLVCNAMIDAILNEPQTSSKPLPSSSGPEMTQEQIEAMERDRT